MTSFRVFVELCFSVVFAFTYILEHLGHLKEKPLSFSLKNVMYVNIIWTGACKLLPALCSPTGGEYFEMGQGFHCEPVIVFQSGAVEVQGSVCEGSCQVQAQW